jgi:putative hydrolase of the HAD superfamily
VLGEGVDQRHAVEEFRALALALVPSHVQALPGAGDLLTTLAERGYRYAILSNGWNPLQQRKADHIGFDGPVFVSDDIGVRKPSVHAFNVLRDAFGLPAERIWYVGDDPRADVLGALNAGMKAMWFDWEHKKFPTDVPGPSAIISAIGDVLAHLE